jgi:putative phosphotransacetylase
MTNQKVPLEVSVRHVHLCKGDFEKLFGKGYELKIRNEMNTTSKLLRNS